MITCNSRWLRRIVFCLVIVSVCGSASQAAQSELLLVLNDIGDILKIDIDQGQVLSRTYIPEAYYSNRILADPKGRYILVGGGAQLGLFLDPGSLNIKGILKPEIPRLPWEKNDQGYNERLSGFASIYGGKLAITPNGEKIYFKGGLVDELRSTIVIDPLKYEITKKIEDYFIYPDTIFSADGKLMFINHHRTKEILIIDTNTDQIIKGIKPLSEQDKFHSRLLYFNSVTKRLLIPYFSGSKAEWSLVWVDTDNGKITNIMNDPFEGKKGKYAASSEGSYFVYNEYVSVPIESRPNQTESVYTGKVKIVDLQTMSRQTLSFLERYQPENWNLALKCYMVPGQEKMVLIIRKRVNVIDRGPTYWNPKLRHRKLLQPVHLLVVDLQTATIEKSIEIPEGGFKDLTFLPWDGE